MTLFLSLLPIYLLGNFHCLGMCGPLVSLLAKHPHRHLYFLGRICSYALLGLCVGEIGVLIHSSALSAYFSLLIGAFILLITFHAKIPGRRALLKRLIPLSQKLALLSFKEKMRGPFLFGFLTLLLPCGQTLVVFSALALCQSAWLGLFNGAIFALFTTPALFFALRLSHVLQKKISYLLVAVQAGIGTIAILRALSAFELIPHLSFTFHKFELVFF